MVGLYWIRFGRLCHIQYADRVIVSQVKLRRCFHPGQSPELTVADEGDLQPMQFTGHCQQKVTVALQDMAQKPGKLD